MDEETRVGLGLELVNTSHSLQYSLLYKNKREFCTKLVILEHVPSAEKSDR